MRTTRYGGGGSALHQRGIVALAWISYLLAVVAGAALVDTWVGGIVTWAVGVFPVAVAALALVAGTVAMLIDLLVDRIPNRLAVWMALVLPSVAAAVDGRLATTVTSISRALLEQVGAGLGTWIGDASSLGVALGAAVASLLVARRVIAKGGGM